MGVRVLLCGLELLFVGLHLWVSPSLTSDPNFKIDVVTNSWNDDLMANPKFESSGPFRGLPRMRCDEVCLVVSWNDDLMANLKFNYQMSHV